MDWCGAAGGLMLTSSLRVSLTAYYEEHFYPHRLRLKRTELGTGDLASFPCDGELVPMSGSFRA